MNLFSRARSVASVRVVAALLAGIAAATQVACANDGGAAEKPQQPPAVSATDNAVPEVLATIGTEKVTLGDVRGRAGDQLDQLDVQYRRMRDRIITGALDSIVHERMIAAETKKTGKSGDDLVVAEMKGGATPSDVEIAAWYAENQARLNGRTLDQVKPQIVDLLSKQRRTEAAAKLEERLRKEQAVKVTFEPYRMTFANSGAPTLGKKDAPITLVEFSDFQCPYCQAAAPVLKQVAQKFGDKVQIIYRQYPIPSLHPFALKAAEASLCANEQGKFWELHDAMFADQKKLAVSDLKATAKRLGVDSKKFDACLDSGRYVEQVQNDQREASKIGVNGTPAMFINGQYVEGGSVPFSVLEALINKELARLNSKS